MSTIDFFVEAEVEEDAGDRRTGGLPSTRATLGCRGTPRWSAIAAFDRDRRRPRPPPLRPVQARGRGPAGGRPTSVSWGANRARRLLIRAMSSAGWNGLDQVVIGPGPQAHEPSARPPVRRPSAMMIGTWPVVPFLGPDLRRDLVPVELGQHHVEQDQVRGPPPPPQPEALCAIGPRRTDPRSPPASACTGGQAAGTFGSSIDDEDLGRHQSPSSPRKSESAVGSPTCGL